MHLIMMNITNKNKIKNLIFYFIAFVLVPTLIAIGLIFMPSKSYAVVSIVIAILINVIFLFDFERKKTTTREIVLIAVMVALTVVSRLLFAPIPSFKPVTSIVIIAGIAFGARAGYITGAMAAVVSDIFFGQGPWTPFQMLVWGIIGFFAGVFFYGKTIKLWLVMIYSMISGVVFSVIMDIWTVIAIENTFSLIRYSQVLLASLPFMAIYAVSNLIFTIVLTKPFMKKLNRIKDKFGVFCKS